jgi:hypothetical protein
MVFVLKTFPAFLGVSGIHLVVHGCQRTEADKLVCSFYAANKKRMHVHVQKWNFPRHCTFGFFDLLSDCRFAIQHRQFGKRLLFVKNIHEVVFSFVIFVWC